MITVDQKTKKQLVSEVQAGTHLVTGASIPLFTDYIRPVRVLSAENTSFLRERIKTVLARKRANFVVIKNTRDDHEIPDPADFIEFPIHDCIAEIKTLLEEAFGAKVISEYVLIAKAARIDRHRDYENDFFPGGPSSYRVPVGVSLFLGPEDGSPFEIYAGQTTITQNEPGTLAVFGAKVEHGHPLGHDSYYIVYQPTLEFPIDCKC